MKNRSIIVALLCILATENGETLSFDSSTVLTEDMMENLKTRGLVSVDGQITKNGHNLLAKQRKDLNFKQLVNSMQVPALLVLQLELFDRCSVEGQNRVFLNTILRVRETDTPEMKARKARVVDYLKEELLALEKPPVQRESKPAATAVAETVAPKPAAKRSKPSPKFKTAGPTPTEDVAEGIMFNPLD